MNFVWYNILLLCVAGILFAFGALELVDDAGISGFVALIALACVGGAFFLTWVRASNHRDSVAKAQLQHQGFSVNNADTADQEVTLNIGACKRTLDIRKVEGVWQVYIASQHAEQTVFTPETAKQFGQACS